MMNQKKPNLLLFMPETLRADAIIGPAGQKAHTPNFDRLAGEGTNFTNAYAQMSYCTPSRCSMFTGLYPHTNGHRSIWHLLQGHERNLFQDLKEAGYRTVVFGKNDLIDSTCVDQSFDEYEVRIKPSGRPAVKPSAHAEKMKRAMYAGCFEEEEGCIDNDTAIIQSALDFLDEDHEQPWCLFLPLSYAHPTYVVEEPYYSMHDRSEIAEPIAIEVEDKRSFKKALHHYYGCDSLDNDDYKEIKATYLGMVSRCDWYLEQLMDKMKEKSLDDDTVVVAFSDHGDYAGDYGLIEKFCGGFEDCLLNVPLIFRGPGIQAGTTCSSLCEMTDLYPTLLDLAGVESRHFHFGKSLVPALKGDSSKIRTEVFAEGGRLQGEEQFPAGNVVGNPTSFYGGRMKLLMENFELLCRASMVRTDRYKYVYAPNDRDELYDIERDPQQTENLVNDPEYQQVKQALKDKIMIWLHETTDTLPLTRGKRSWT